MYSEKQIKWMQIFGAILMALILGGFFGLRAANYSPHPIAAALGGATPFILGLPVYYWVFGRVFRKLAYQQESSVARQASQFPDERSTQKLASHMQANRSLNTRRYGYLFFIVGAILSFPFLIIFIEPKIEKSFAQYARDRAIASNAAKQHKSVPSFMDSVQKSCSESFPQPKGFQEAPERFESYLDQIGKCIGNGLFSDELKKVQRVITIVAWGACIFLALFSGFLLSLFAIIVLLLIRFVKYNLINWLTTD